MFFFVTAQKHLGIARSRHCDNLAPNNKNQNINRKLSCNSFVVIECHAKWNLI